MSKHLNVYQIIYEYYFALLYLSNCYYYQHMLARYVLKLYIGYI